MTTNRALITDALRDIGVLDADESASNEDASLALRELNRLIALLPAEGIDLGCPPQDNLSDDFPLDEVSAAQVISLLALRLTKHFPSPTVSPALIAEAGEAKAQLLRTAALANMEEASLTNIPRGEGRLRRGNIISGD